MKKVKKVLALLLVSAFALCLLTSCGAAEERSYTLPAAVTVKRDDGTTTVYTFSYCGNQVTVEADGVTLSEDACNDEGHPTKHDSYEQGEFRARVTYRYDKDGRLIRYTHEDVAQEYSEEEITYDSEGRMVERISKRKNGDLLQKLVYEYGENGSRTETMYRSDGARSHATAYTYDGEGRMTEIAYIDGDGSVSGSRTWEYDEVGRLVRECERDGEGNIDRQTEYTYDEQGRETRTLGVDKDGTPYDRTETVYAADGSYTASSYDGNGLLYNRSTYDADGKLSEERNYSDGEDSTPIVIAYTYDECGFLTRRVVSCDGVMRETREVTETCTLSLTEEAYRFFMTLVERNAF